MIAFLARRIAAGALVLLVVSLLSFLVFHVLPAGDPAEIRAGRLASPEQVAEIRGSLGLDDPWYVQYGRFLERLVFHGDLGRSYLRGTEVRPEIADRLPATAALALGAFVIWSLAGLALGVLGARGRGGRADRAANLVALLFMSAPAYWLGLVVLLAFAQDIGAWPILPGSGSYPLEGTLLTRPAAVAESLILPWFVLAAGFAAVQGRLLRVSMGATLRRDFVRTARAKGVSERRVVLRHALPPAATPVLSAAGVELAALLGGAVLIESAFNIPGLGRLAIEAAGEGDLPIIEATVLVAAAAVVVLSILVDLAYGLIDPRVRR